MDVPASRPSQPPADSPVRAAGPSDAELLHAIAVGSPRALEELRRRYRAAVEGVCRTLLSRDSAEDCAQEVFTRIWQKAGLFDAGRGTAAAWLLTLTRDVARNVRAKRFAEPRPAEQAEGAGEAPAVDRFWLEAGLERLPPQERTVIELAYYEDLTQTEIASALGVPLGSVKSWTRRAGGLVTRLVRRGLLAAIGAGIALTLLLSGGGSRNLVVLRSADGQVLARARIEHAGAADASLALVAERMPARLGRVFVLWARPPRGGRVIVGRFMVDGSGYCRTRLRLRDHSRWSTLWVTPARDPRRIVAST